MPLVVIGLIAFLFIRSCIGDLDLGFGLGGSDQEDRDLSATTTTAPEDGQDGESVSPEDDPALAAMLEPVEPECPEDGEEGETTRHLQWTEAPPTCIDQGVDYTAVLETSRGIVEIELDAENAPQAVNNFVFLARWHFYDSVNFHVVRPDDHMQAGDPTAIDREPSGPGYTLEPEGVDNDVRYPLHSVGMVASTEEGSLGRMHGSQFFVVTGTEAPIPPNYTVFGQITDPESQEVVDAIDGTGIARAGHDGTPAEETTIETVTIRES